MEKKICKNCKDKKELDLFNRFRRGNKEYYTTKCRVCRNKDRTEKRKQDPLKEKLRKIKQIYKLSGDKYLQMIKNQNDSCKICKKTNIVLEVDHCHTTLKVRGLLCSQCNVGLGSFFDRPELLREAANYLENKDS